MIHLDHLLHPVRSAKSAQRKIRQRIQKAIAQRQLHMIRRGQVDRCWCDGELLPFKWHASYGVCANCGCHVNRRPPLDLKELYSCDFYWRFMQETHGYPPIEARAELYKNDGRLAYWLQLIARYAAPQGTVIEVGCAPGVLLAELQTKGYKCIGVEPSPDTAHWVQTQMHVNVQAGLFPGMELPQCDVFMAFDVLEHSPRPVEFLQEVARLLNPGGFAIIQTPIERYGYEPPFGEAFGSAFKEYEHLFLFNNKAMEKLAARAGLEIIESKERLWLHHEICVLRKIGT